MRLERLEISGFKSFSDRAELAFDEGVTAIVGPNGCGKSNVADAITWVLGEQSAKSLRGDKMEDVIFSGSDARKPGGAAEVRLRLSGLPIPPKPVPETPAHPSATEPFRLDAPDSVPGHEDTTNGHGNGHGNGHAPVPVLASPTLGMEALEDFARIFTRDVEVTRRLYRSGDSEYLIDGEVCRLRDVHELLMDTGLGAKAYSIIEQGKIGMILSTRPADRRQLIEEAAGITKYKSRRRAAELKLEAAQQNLTRIDDIVFEVEKQRGTLKRQAAKARRYKRLRDELRRWEKVLFARRYRELAAAIEGARARLAQARERETAAAARLAELEADLSRLRIELAEADQRASSLREDAHARELAVTARQQQQEFSEQQAASLAGRATDIEDEIRDLEARREPARIALESRRTAAADAERDRDEAATRLAAATQEHADAQRAIEALEGDVDAVRSEVFSHANTATALRHAIQHAVDQIDRVGTTLSELDVERDDLRRETEGVEAERAQAQQAAGETRAALANVVAARQARELELATLRAEHDGRLRDIRTREQEAAAAEARLASLQELASSHADFGDAARAVLAQNDASVSPRGAVADYLDVDRRYERAVEACLGELLQYILVDGHDQAAAGLASVRAGGAGRCGFVVAGGTAVESPAPVWSHLPGITAVTEAVRVAGPYAATLRVVLGEAYIADTFEQAVAFARVSDAPVATLDGDVLRGAHLVSGGARVEARGILATRREIKELTERTAVERQVLLRAAEAVTQLEAAIAAAAGSLAALQTEQHEHEKSLVGFDAQLARTVDETARLARKSDQIGLERRRAEEERAAADARRQEADAATVRLLETQREAETRLADAQRRLAEARDTVAGLALRLAEAGAAHAGLVERAAALAAEVARLEDSARELEARVEARRTELAATRERREALLTAIEEGARALDADIQSLAALRDELVRADEAATARRADVDAKDVDIRTARQALEAVRAEANEFDMARATSESDLTHLAQVCVDTVQATLDEVLADVEALELAGQDVPDAAAIAAEEPDPEADEAEPGEAAAAVMSEPVAASAPPASMSAEEAITRLREKIDRLGPVNMMAIEQFDELETRHVFLTTQRKDLVESIALTTEAITRIDETTSARFTEAFTAIQQNFQVTFSTLFGGGRAGLTLLDESDPLESGIDIVASPPGKRLQSVQLLSGGEKALTAIALMFAIFRYKPSPFCLLDEIDAPLDDANVGRFVEMLRGMLDHTQFILITHNRRTMEIANRLYGVTMEEPGVSKLISVQLH
ncbi:MAG TPA: chromosome segregation protein SMC [Vicinamibacterales bacterium]|jgi:chromosome segregation protein|nr:chromosome segregation protein SMC [Vicinamibacterales bacterium]